MKSSINSSYNKNPLKINNTSIHWTISLFMTLTLIPLSFQLLIPTGDDNLYFKKQNVSVGFITLSEKQSIYYQYFERDPYTNSTFKEINDEQSYLLYIGHNISKSALPHAFLGVFPYTISKNKSSESPPQGLQLNYNPDSLNSLFPVIVADVVRGTGYNTNSDNSTKVDYDLIASDLDRFIQEFSKAENLDFNKSNLIIYAGYEMV